MPAGTTHPAYLYRINRRFYFTRRMRWTEVFFHGGDDSKDSLLWFAWEAGSPWGPDEDQDYLVHGLKLTSEMVEALFEEAYADGCNEPARPFEARNDNRQWRLAEGLTRSEWDALIEERGLDELVEALEGQFGGANQGKETDQG